MASLSVVLSSVMISEGPLSAPLPKNALLGKISCSFFSPHWMVSHFSSDTTTTPKGSEQAAWLVDRINIELPKRSSVDVESQNTSSPACCTI